MAANLGLMPNEAILMQEVSVAHGGVMAIYTDDLYLTNYNLICVSKGMFGNTKKIFKYPLNQINRYNGNPQVLMGKLSNGTACMDVYFMSGTESFNFQSGNKKKIKEWIDAITKAVSGNATQKGNDFSDDDDSEYDEEDTLVGAFKEVGDEFKEVGKEFLDVLGIKTGKKKNKGAVSEGPVKISKKCMSCSAPLTGNKGQVVKCRYCDTEQTL